MGVKGSAFRPVELEVVRGQVPVQLMGLLVVPPGEYETACGKGYYGCEPGEPTKLRLAGPALDSLWIG